MAVGSVGSEVTGSWLLSSGVVSFFILLLLLSIFLTALCSDCGRRSFELRDPEVDKNPSGLIRVVKLEEAMGARENPMINEIQNDETEGTVTPWRSHLGAPQNHRDLQTNSSSAVTKTSESETSGDENSVPFTPWRSHLGAPQTGVNGSAHPEPIYHVIREGRGSFDVSSPPANHEPRQEEAGSRSVASVDLSERDRNSVYARVSKKVRLTTPPTPDPTPEGAGQEEQEEQEEEEEEDSPPLPDRKTSLEG